MADIDDGHARLVAQALQIGQDLGLALLVERGERLVHQEKARRGEQRPADGDALLLAAGKIGRLAVEEVADAEEVDHAAGVFRARALGQEPAAVVKVLPHGEMREEPCLLEDIAEAAAVRRHEEAAGGIDQHVAVERNAPFRRAR